MDARKIQFLIAIQREIDKLEAQEGESTRVERLKSRFYDVVEVEKVAGDIVSVIEKVDNTESKLKDSPDSSTKKDRTSFCPHHPRFVVSFLNNFRQVNDTGLRELIHLPYDEVGFDLQETLNKLENELFPNQPNYAKFSKSERIPYFLWVHIRKDLIDVYRNYGLSYWKRTNVHPLFKDELLTNKVTAFVKSIRFGQDQSTDTSFRVDIIPNIIKAIKKENDEDRPIKKKLRSISYEKNLSNNTPLILNETEQKNKIEALNYQGVSWLNEHTIDFRPNGLTFDANMVFMSDVIRIEYAIKVILKLIVEKSNLYGEPINQSNREKKRVIFNARYTRNENKDLVTILTITDVGSWCTKYPDYLFNSGDLQGIIQNLWSLCEWEITARFADGLTYRLDMLNSKEMGKNIIVDVEENILGFTHSLTFYH